MKVLVIICVILGIISITLAVRLAYIKSGLRKIKEELVLTRNKSYNRQITIPLIDNGLSEITAEINNNLSYQKQLKLEAERSERVIRQSISDIAHDLRTPLTVIKGNLQLVGEEEKLSSKGREHLRVCMEKTDILKSMTDDFFEMSVLESDDCAAELEKTDITALFLQFIADSEAVISQAGLAPEIKFPEKSMFIYADETMLLRMLGNLLNNVLKYAEDTFTAELYESEGSSVISFSNSLSKDKTVDTSRLFERTWRGDRARQSGGAGLGLYIVKLLAVKQNAEVSAEVIDGKLYLKMFFPIKQYLNTER